jgi:hypothetical protein
VIEAVRYDGRNYREIVRLARDRAGDVAERYLGGLTIYTLEGRHRAEVGDWIIRGVAGELYPCKPDIFDQTYEPVEEHGE